MWIYTLECSEKIVVTTERTCNLRFINRNLEERYITLKNLSLYIVSELKVQKNALQVEEYMDCFNNSSVIDDFNNGGKT